MEEAERNREAGRYEQGRKSKKRGRGRQFSEGDWGARAEVAQLIDRFPGRSVSERKAHEEEEDRDLDKAD